MITKDTPMFDDTSLADIFKKIYKNSEHKSGKIDGILDKVKDLLGTIADASIMLPIIKEVLEIAVKNDEQLVKLAAIIQRILDKSENEKNNGASELLSQEEKEQLLKANSEQHQILTTELIDEKIEKLNEQVVKAKEHIKANEKNVINNITIKNEKDKNTEDKNIEPTNKLILK